MILPLIRSRADDAGPTRNGGNEAGAGLFSQLSHHDEKLNEEFYLKTRGFAARTVTYQRVPEHVRDGLRVCDHLESSVAALLGRAERHGSIHFPRR